MTLSWNHELLDQLDFAWNVQFMPRMEDLTDAEYLWEPVDGCLTVRPAGDGTFRLDANVRASPPPFTTIAWRIGHMASVFGRRASNHFGDASFDEASVRWPGTASGALEILIGEYGRWHAGVESLGEDRLLEPSGPHEGPFAESPKATLVLHITREFLHHAAEIALLRDLYRDTVAKGELTLRGPGT